MEHPQCRQSQKQGKPMNFHRYVTLLEGKHGDLERTPHHKPSLTAINGIHNSPTMELVLWLGSHHVCSTLVIGPDRKPNRRPIGQTSKIGTERGACSKKGGCRTLDDPTRKMARRRAPKIWECDDVYTVYI